MLDHDRYGLAAAYAVVSAGAGFAAVWFATAAIQRRGGLRLARHDY